MCGVRSDVGKKKNRPGVLIVRRRFGSGTIKFAPKSQSQCVSGRRRTADKNTYRIVNAVVLLTRFVRFGLSVSRCVHVHRVRMNSYVHCGYSLGGDPEQVARWFFYLRRIKIGRARRTILGLGTRSVNSPEDPLRAKHDVSGKKKKIIKGEKKIHMTRTVTYRNGQRTL